MAFVGPLDAFNSKPIQTTVPGSTKPLFTATSTKVTKDSIGKVTGGTTTVYYSPDAGQYVPAATTTDGGKTWTYLKDSSGKEVLGAGAKTSLEKGALKTNTQQQIVAATKIGPLGGGGLSTEEQKIVAPSTQNTSTTSASGDAIGTVDSLKEQVQDKPGGVRTKYEDFNSLRYPLDRNTKQDYIKFSMFRYSPRKVDVGQARKEGDLFGPRASNRTILGSTSLPIQPNISDTNAVVWGEDRMDPIAATFQMAALQLISGEPPDTVAGDVAGQAQQNPGPLKALVGFSLAQAAVGTQGGNLLTRATGGIVNPNLELLFQGPSLRGFTFNFTLSAREEKEAQVIKKIIRFFKQGMSVKRASTALFLMSPNTFGISYIYGGTGKEHPWMNRIKECALQNFTVNYTPAGNYATYEDGAMTQYDLQMTFSELDPIYDDDYAEADKAVGGGLDSSIGY